MKIEEINVPGWERVFHAVDSKSGLDSYIAIHNTVKGPALGGLRHWKYEDTDSALTDVLRLSEGMTYKNALSGIPFGGGKAVINGEKTHLKLLAFADFLNEVWELGGEYYTAEDVGTNITDMYTLFEQSAHLFTPGVGHPSPATSLGVFKAMQAGLRYDAIVRKNLPFEEFIGMRGRRDITVAIQGLGAVGYDLAAMCHLSGFNLIVADINNTVCDKAKEEFGATVIPVDDILFTDATITSPCALGAVLNSESIAKMDPNTIICGSANNQLLDMVVHGNELHERGMVYVPDFIANAGGVMNISRETGMVPTDFHVACELDLIYHNATQCLIESKKFKKPAAQVALDMAKRIIDN